MIPPIIPLCSSSYIEGQGGCADGAGDGDAFRAVRRAGDVPLRDGPDEPCLTADRKSVV